MGNHKEPSADQPPCCLFIGMAGSGKTTLMKKFSSFLTHNDRSAYIVNLDPAVSELPYIPNIDIRDTVNYKGVMEDLSLGPNGSIMTAMNLFATRIDQVIEFVEKRSEDNDVIMFDTPGQIEVFTWSASGTIITESLASVIPTVLVYVVDTPRSVNPTTFVSNMLYACSIMYRLRLPLVVAFNKTDVQDPELLVEWLTCPDSMESRVMNFHSEEYVGTFTRALGDTLSEFRKVINFVCVSAATGEGLGELLIAIEEAKGRYFELFQYYMKKKQQEKEKEMKKKASKLMKKVNKDLEPEDTIRLGHQEEEEDEEEEEEMEMEMEMEMGAGEQTVELTAQELEEEKERAEFESLMEMADEMKRERAMRED